MSQSNQQGRSQPDADMILRMIEENRVINAQRHQDNCAKLDHLATEMERFHGQYEATLRAIKEERQRIGELRRAVVEKSLVGIAWALLVFIAYAAWAYLKEHVK